MKDTLLSTWGYSPEQRKHMAALLTKVLEGRRNSLSFGEDQVQGTEKMIQYLSDKTRCAYLLHLYFSDLEIMLVDSARKIGAYKTPIYNQVVQPAKRIETLAWALLRAREDPVPGA